MNRSIVALAACLFSLLPGGGHAESPSAAVEGFRSRGRAGLDEFLSTVSESSPGYDELLDRICAQKDCRYSKLFWYTDLEAAKDEARRRNLPVLSLRMLGDLRKDLSCANSRFFRSFLYPDSAVREQMEKFVLHWSSEREVPTVLIDFGNGTTYRTTLTGNSIHYVLSPNGTVIDALPGLYDPAEFARQLARASGMAKKAAADQSGNALLREHAALLESIVNEWGAALGWKVQPSRSPPRRFPSFPPGKPLEGLAPQILESAKNLTTLAYARKALDLIPIAGMDTTSSKMFREQPTLGGIVFGTTETGRSLEGTPSRWSDLIQQMSPESWKNLSLKRRDDIKFDDSVLALMRRKAPELMQNENEVLERTKDSLALDTIRNQYLLHTQIYTWLLQSPGMTFEALNARVYGELFDSNVKNRWYGLYPEGLFVALDDNGLSKSS